MSQLSTLKVNMKEIKANIKSFLFNIKGNELIQINKSLVISWAIAVSFFAFFFYFGEMNQQILPGVTEAREHIINFKEAVIIDKILVQSGQFVRKSEPLFILNRPDLKVREAENNTSLRETIVEMNILKNKEYSAIQWFEILKVKKDEGKTLNPLEFRFLSLYEMDLYIQTEKENLNVLSPVDGYAGEIHFNRGETVAPYSKIISLFQIKPSVVTSFIPESYDLSELNKNRTSIIKSMSRDLQIKGEIISVATMLSELPMRFQKDPTNKLFGREIKIAIPDENSFYLGEKVYVTLDGV
jgi:hypothetical protein